MTETFAASSKEKFQKMPQDRSTRSAVTMLVQSFRPTKDDMAKCINNLSHGKSIGPDGTPAEI